MQSHGPLLNELARYEEQINGHLDTIDRQANLVYALLAVWHAQWLELASRATSMAAPTFSPAPTTAGSRGSATVPGPN